ncbi:MAG: galactokinase [Bacilli bacterium]|nr:galactokinase [Bacilli bacterium]
MENKLINKFESLYNQRPDAIYRAPARVNLIGEHIDYNGGMVLPVAISLYTYVLVSLRNDNKICLASDSFNDLVIERSLDNIAFDKEVDWINYPVGLIDTLKKMGVLINRGMNLYFYSNIPLGSGLSSSASILIATIYMLNDMFGLGFNNEDLVRISVKSEREFNGLTCGIMDEASIALAKVGTCLYLDTANFTYKYINMDLKGYSLAILKTNKPRKLTDSKYNERVKECEIALNHVKKNKEVNNLCELTKDDLYLLNELDDTIKNRATHVILENERVKEFIKCFESADLVRCGELLNESHFSLKNLYEVTGEHLDIITEIARNQTGVLGSRMTGAGFGGCAIALVDKNEKENFKNNVEKEYKKVLNIDLEVIFIDIVGGPEKNF